MTVKVQGRERQVLWRGCKYKCTGSSGCQNRALVQIGQVELSITWKRGMCLQDHVYISKHALYIEWHTATVYACVSADHIMKPGERTGAPGGACLRSENMPTYWGTQCGALWQGMWEIMERARAVLGAGREEEPSGERTSNSISKRRRLRVQTQRLHYRQIPVEGWS